MVGIDPDRDVVTGSLISLSFVRRLREGGGGSVRGEYTDRGRSPAAQCHWNLDPCVPAP